MVIATLFLRRALLFAVPLVVLLGLHSNHQLSGGGRLEFVDSIFSSLLEGDWNASSDENVSEASAQSPLGWIFGQDNVSEATAQSPLGWLFGQDLQQQDNVSEGSAESQLAWWGFGQDLQQKDRGNLHDQTAVDGGGDAREETGGDEDNDDHKDSEEAIADEEDSKEADSESSSQSPDQERRKRKKLGTISPVVWTYGPFNMVHTHSIVHWIFLPLLATLREAFVKRGLELRHGGFENVCEVVDNVRAAIQEDLVPVIIVVGWHLMDQCPAHCKWFKHDACDIANGLQEVRNLGAHIILYNSESQLHMIQDRVESINKTGAKEVWTYSKVLKSRLLEKLAESKTAPPGVSIRWVPPGCTSALDFNVSLDVPWRDVKTTGFIGELKKMGHRQRVVSTLHFSPTTSVIYSSKEARRYIEKFPLQLNLHGQAGCDALEAFRMSLLLTNKACVVSEGVSDVDSADFQDIITFTDASHGWSAMKRAVSTKLGNASAMRACQENSRKVYCKRFSPDVILHQSGFMDQWVQSAASATDVFGMSAGLGEVGSFKVAHMNSEVVQIDEVVDAKEENVTLGTISPVVWTFSPFNYNGGTAHWIFMPVLVTLKEAFAKAGLELRYGGFENSCEVVRSVALAVQHNLVPVVILVGWHLMSGCSRGKCWMYQKDECDLAATLHMIVKLNAYIILYNSESRQTLFNEQVESVASMKAKEIWTYSKLLRRKLLMSLAELRIPGVRIRYLPPGCAADLDFNVDVDAVSRDDRISGFIGNVHGIGHRMEVLAPLGNRVQRPESMIRNSTGVRLFMEKHPVQLNIHGHSDHAVLEIFRLSMLLSNRACVVSEAVDKTDGDEFKDVIRFANPRRGEEAIKQEVDKLGSKAAIRECQDRSRKIFCTRYIPAELLNKSGFLHHWKINASAAEVLAAAMRSEIETGPGSLVENITAQLRHGVRVVRVNKTTGNATLTVDNRTSGEKKKDRIRRFFARRDEARRKQLLRQQAQENSTSASDTKESLDKASPEPLQRDASVAEEAATEPQEEAEDGDEPAAAGLADDGAVEESVPQLGPIGGISPVVWTYSPFNYNGGLAHWIFYPLLATLKEALEHHGLELRYGGFENVCEVLQSVKQALDKKIVPIVILVGWHLISGCPRKCKAYKKDTCNLQDGLQEIISLGAYLILYNDESEYEKLEAQVEEAATLKAKEMWTFSRVVHTRLKTMLSESTKTTGVEVRYFPPGCASALDFHVDWQAKKRDYKKAGFMGHTYRIGHRERMLDTLGKSVEATRAMLSNRTAVRGFLQRYPLQVNLHRHSSHNVLGLFDMSMLLTNKACVISEPVLGADATDFEDIVQFTSSKRSDLSMKWAIAQLSGDKAAIEACQDRSHKLYCTKFSPNRILWQSGLLDQWRTDKSGSTVR
mmetsp:Transcript_44632/g.105847  ORF Transcript_44632/g.105847 Transcript_44632/m.105847 type:complete len:1400 (+) Transcript_44632:107-4306(+)